MKVTLDLPDDLVRTMKLKAVHESRKFKDVVAEQLRASLTVAVSPGESPRGVKSLPVLKGSRSGTPHVTRWSARQMSEWIKEQAADDKTA